jgi:hypothetical protein
MPVIAAPLPASQERIEPVQALMFDVEDYGKLNPAKLRLKPTSWRRKYPIA